MAHSILGVAVSARIQSSPKSPSTRRALPPRYARRQIQTPRRFRIAAFPLFEPAPRGTPSKPSNSTTAAKSSSKTNSEFEAVGIAVHEAMEEELSAIQSTVAEAVEQALHEDRGTFDIRANFNTLVAVTGVVVFERGVWNLWDLVIGDSLLSEFASIGFGLIIMGSIRLFNIPLAEWRRPTIGTD